MKKSITFFSKVIILLLLSFVLACDNEEEPPYRQINDNIVLVQSCCGEINSGNFGIAPWANQNTVYTGPGLNRMEIDNEYKVIDFGHINIPNGFWGAYHFIQRNRMGTKLLAVRSPYADVSLGSLLEINKGLLMIIQIHTPKRSY